jgi:hypothetical protein
MPGAQANASNKESVQRGSFCNVECYINKSSELTSHASIRVVVRYILGDKLEEIGFSVGPVGWVHLV